jgi:RHS repeat-associated protein
MQVPNRFGSIEDYRYGFNGKEKDDEVKGKGLQIDYGFRVYDSRIGKFLSQDPLFKSYPWYTPYQFAGNKPIAAIDLDGLEEKIVIMHSTQSGKVRREVYDYKTLRKTTDYIGVKNSARTQPISASEFISVKNSLWDAFSSTPELFASGHEAYTIGMNDSKYKNSGFKGLFKGTLTIASSPNNNLLIYEKNQIEKAKPSTIQILKDATDPKKNPEMVKGIDTAKKYVAGVSAVISGTALVYGEAAVLSVNSLGLISDIDQLTGATENLIENTNGNTQNIINVAKVLIDIVSISRNIEDVLKFNLVKTNPSSVFPETISAVPNTAADIQDALKDNP